MTSLYKNKMKESIPFQMLDGTFLQWSIIKQSHVRAMKGNERMDEPKTYVIFTFSGSLLSY